MPSDWKWIVSAGATILVALGSWGFGTYSRIGATENALAVIQQRLNRNDEDRTEIIRRLERIEEGVNMLRGK